MTVSDAGLALHKAYCRKCPARPRGTWACAGGCESTIGFEYMMDPDYRVVNMWEGVDL